MTAPHGFTASTTATPSPILGRTDASSVPAGASPAASNPHPSPAQTPTSRTPSPLSSPSPSAKTRTPAPAKILACGRAPAPFDTLTLPQYDQLRDKLLTTRLETLQDWAQKEFPTFQPPPRQAWLDLYTRTLLQIIREERPATKDLELLLLEKYPSSHGFRIADTAIAGLQRHLDEALAQPQPDAKQIKIWFTLLIEQEKVDIDRHRYGMKPPASKLSEAQIRKEMWDILGIPMEDQNRVEAEIQADRAKEAAALGRTDAPSVPAGASPAEPPTEPTPDNPHHPTDLLGQPMDQPTHHSESRTPAHPFSAFMALPLDPSTDIDAPSGTGTASTSPGAAPERSHAQAPDLSGPTQKTGGGAHRPNGPLTSLSTPN